MLQLIKDPTRATKNSNSAIGHLYSHAKCPLSCVIPVGLSDHNMIGCVRKMNSLTFQASQLQ